MPAITNVNELQNMNLNLAGNYWLANDIDASGFGFDPIGDWLNPFTGALNGKGYKIDNLTITLNGSGRQDAALIVENEGTIQNLGITNCQISITVTNPLPRAYAGGITIGNSGVINNCYVTGSIAITFTGGTSGYTPAAGGLICVNYGVITKCYSTATVTIIGNPSPTIYGGGFVALNFGTISKSHATGDVVLTASAGTSRARGGSFTAENDGYWTDAIIVNCYAKGDVIVTGGDVSNYAGGFVYWNNYGILINCYSIGVPTGASGVGGFCQYNESGTITACFWDTQTSGTAVSDGGTGKTTAQMKTKATFTAANWDFIIIWFINGITNDGYPFFFAMPPEPLPDAPRATVLVQDKITLEAVRNVEMAAGGRFYVDEEGKATYKSRHARNL